jgi:hypothetical protein
MGKAKDWFWFLCTCAGTVCAVAVALSEVRAAWREREGDYVATTCTVRGADAVLHTDDSWSTGYLDLEYRASGRLYRSNYRYGNVERSDEFRSSFPVGSVRRCFYDASDPRGTVTLHRGGWRWLGWVAGALFLVLSCVVLGWMLLRNPRRRDASLTASAPRH